MPEYVDGFLIAVPKKKMPDYIRTAKLAAKIWREYGALDYRETVADDLKVKFGEPFNKLKSAKPGETIVFAWITYKSRKQRDIINAKVMKDPRIHAMMEKMGGCPFDIDRMTYGGFQTIVR